MSYYYDVHNMYLIHVAYKIIFSLDPFKIWHICHDHCTNDEKIIINSIGHNINVSHQIS